MKNGDAMWTEGDSTIGDPDLLVGRVQRNIATLWKRDGKEWRIGTSKGLQSVTETTGNEIRKKRENERERERRKERQRTVATSLNEKAVRCTCTVLSPPPPPPLLYSAFCADVLQHEGNQCTGGRIMPGPCMLRGQEEGNAAREDRSDSKALPGAGLFASFIRLPLRFSSSYLRVRLSECLFFVRSSVGGGYWNRGNIIYRNAGKNATRGLQRLRFFGVPVCRLTCAWLFGR